MRITAKFISGNILLSSHCKIYMHVPLHKISSTVSCIVNVIPSNFTQIFYTSGSEHHLQSVNFLLDCCSDSILSDDTDTLQKSALFATPGTFWSANDNTGVSQLGGFSNHTYNFQTFYLWFLLLSSILVS